MCQCLQTGRSCYWAISNAFLGYHPPLRIVISTVTLFSMAISASSRDHTTGANTRRTFLPLQPSRLTSHAGADFPWFRFFLDMALVTRPLRRQLCTTGRSTNCKHMSSVFLATMLSWKNMSIRSERTGWHFLAKKRWSTLASNSITVIGHWQII